MITESYRNVVKSYLAGANTASGNYYSLVPIVTPSGTTRYVASTMSTGLLSFSMTQGGEGIKVGSGTTPPTPNDHNLESLITSGLSAMVTSANKTTTSDTVSIVYELAITNISESSITIAEIGAFRKVGQTGASAGSTSTSAIDQYTVFMVDRSLLANPITIPAGAAATVTYTLRSVDSASGITSDDNGKVVANGVLIDQTSRTITANGTYNTTTNNSVSVNVPSNEPNLTSMSISANGTYEASEDGFDGYSSVTVNVSGSSESVLNIPDFIQNSDKSKVLIDLYADDLDKSTFQWGSKLTFSNNLRFSDSDILTFDPSVTAVEAMGLEIATTNKFIGNVSTNKATFYAVFCDKQYVAITNDYYLKFNDEKYISGVSNPEIRAVGLGLAGYGTVGMYPQVDTSLSRAVAIPVNASDFNVFTLTIDNDLAQAKYYVNGTLFDTVNFGEVATADSTIPVQVGGNTSPIFLYFGAIDGIESQQTILANHSIIMNFLQGARIRHPFINVLPEEYFHRHDLPSNASYESLDYNSTFGAHTWGDLTVTGGPLSMDCTGVLTDENTALSYDVSDTSSIFTVFAICRCVKQTNNSSSSPMICIANSSDGSSDITLQGPNFTQALVGGSVSSDVKYDGHSTTALGIYAITVSSAEQVARFYLNGNLMGSIDIENDTYNKVVFGGSYVSGSIDTSGLFRFFHVAIINRAYDHEQVYRVSYRMRSFLYESRIELPPTS